ncbi:hypothetical protein A2U01_0025684, partial [Trifolium medium]|nr:hypothetical protein [Trifolium medium]
EIGRFVLAFGTSPLLDQRDELVPRVRDTIALGFLRLDGLFSRSERHRCWTRETNWNKSIFEEGFHRPSNPTHMILKMAMEIDNFDAHKDSNNISGCDDLLRDSSDTCLDSYACKIGSCDAFHAEMWLFVVHV